MLLLFAMNTFWLSNPPFVLFLLGVGGWGWQGMEANEDVITISISNFQGMYSYQKVHSFSWKDPAVNKGLYSSFPSILHFYSRFRLSIFLKCIEVSKVLRQFYHMKLKELWLPQPFNRPFVSALGWWINRVYSLRASTPSWLCLYRKCP